MLTTEEIKLERQRRIVDYRASGKRGEEWCKQNGISLNSLRYWIREANKENTKQKDKKLPDFVTLPPIGIIAEEKSSFPAAVLHIGKYTIDINNSCNPAILEAVLSTLKRYV